MVFLFRASARNVTEIGAGEAVGGVILRSKISSEYRLNPMERSFGNWKVQPMAFFLAKRTQFTQPTLSQA